MSAQTYLLNLDGLITWMIVYKDRNYAILRPKKWSTYIKIDINDARVLYQTSRVKEKK